LFKSVEFCSNLLENKLFSSRITYIKFLLGNNSMSHRTSQIRNTLRIGHFKFEIPFASDISNSKYPSHRTFKFEIPFASDISNSKYPPHRTFQIRNFKLGVYPTLQSWNFGCIRHFKVETSGVSDISKSKLRVYPTFQSWNFGCMNRF
jgi:hypothetical protein